MGVRKIFRIEFYATADGKEVMAEFLDSLPPKHQSKAFREIDLLEEFGSVLKEPYVKHIEGDIWELRIKFWFYNKCWGREKTPGPIFAEKSRTYDPNPLQ